MDRNYLNSEALLHHLALKRENYNSYHYCTSISSPYMMLKCVNFHTLRTKFINKYDYVRPSMYKFQQLMNTREKWNN